MNQYRHLIEQHFALSETCIEGLYYIQNRLKEGEIDSTVSVFTDFICAVQCLEKTTMKVIHFFPVESFPIIQKLQEKLNQSILLLSKSYPSSDEKSLLRILNQNVVPHYMQWNNYFFRYVEKYIFYIS